MLAQIVKLGVALWDGGFEAQQVPCPLGPVSMRPGRVFDRFSPLEKAPSTARDRAQPKTILMVIESMALRFNALASSRPSMAPAAFCRLVELPANDRAPAAVAPRRELEHEAVGVKLRIGLATGGVIELSHRSPAAGSRSWDRGSSAQP